MQTPFELPGEPRGSLNQWNDLRKQKMKRSAQSNDFTSHLGSTPLSEPYREASGLGSDMVHHLAIFWWQFDGDELEVPHNGGKQNLGLLALNR